MKLRTVAIIIALIIIVDQAIKIWVKTTYPVGLITNVMGFKWFELYFIENDGMAWGWKFGGEWGKMALTLFRLAAVIFGTWYLGRIVKQKYHRGFIVCAALIYAGALGNLIDSMFYGLIFSSSEYPAIASMFPKEGGYAGFLHGKVVDMLHFPLFHGKFPGWFPGWGGDSFEFFSPIFNIADASISTGVITLLVFQKRFFQKHHSDETHPTVETSTKVNDEMQIL